MSLNIQIYQRRDVAFFTDYSEQNFNLPEVIQNFNTVNVATCIFIVKKDFQKQY